MCALYGFYNVGHVVSHSTLTRLLRVLSIQSECRGTDASGIGYVSNGTIRIFKEPKPAHKMNFQFPAETICVTGHNRAATHGLPAHNCNNHPFVGKVENTEICLCHNGVLLNSGLNLPKTNIETDSYAAVQLLEQKGTLDFPSIKFMSETVWGSFAFTVLDADNNLYLIKGENPIVLVFFEKLGLYVYASTEDILKRALKKCRLHKIKPMFVELKCGDIVRIDPTGDIQRSTFNLDYFSKWDGFTWCSSGRGKSFNEADYKDLMELAGICSIPEEEIFELLDLGYSESEIVELLENPKFFDENKNELLDSEIGWYET